MRESRCDAAVPLENARGPLRLKSCTARDVFTELVWPMCVLLWLSGAPTMTHAQSSVEIGALRQQRTGSLPTPLSGALSELAEATRLATEGDYLRSSRIVSSIDESAFTPDAKRYLAALKDHVSDSASQQVARFEWPQDKVDIAYERETKATPIIAVGINGASWTAGVDFGAGLTVLTETVANKVGARKLGDAPTTRDGAGRVVETRLVLVDLSIGALRVTDVVALVMADEKLQFRVAGFKVAGFDALIGWNVLRDMRVTFDDLARKVTLSPSTPIPAVRNFWWLGQPFTKCTSGQQPGLFAIDTGANKSSITKVWAELTKLSATGERTSKVAGAGGSEWVTVQDFPAFSCEGIPDNYNFPPSSTSTRKSSELLDLDGVIGADILKGRRVTLDFRAGFFSVEAINKQSTTGK